MATFTCPICGKQRDGADHRHRRLIPAGARRLLRRRHPSWDEHEGACVECLADAKVGEMQEMLAADGDLTEDESEVLDSIRENRLVSAEEDFAAEDREERAITAIARAIGSWAVFGAILAFLITWVVVNLSARPFEPYPVIVFAVTSAVLASLAALEGPLIIMSQRQQRLRDRERARADYRVNLKAELEIRYLDEKVDLLLRANEELRDEIAHLRTDTP